MINVLFEITSLCNLHCPSCPEGRLSFAHAHEPFTYASLDMCDKVFKKIKSFEENATVLLYRFSEPLLHPNIHEILELAGQYDLDTYISSNLMIKTDWERLLSHKSLKRLTVSTSGATQEIYERGHRGGHVSRLLKHLEEIAEVAKGKDIEIVLFFHQYTDNVEDEQFYRELCKEYNIAFRAIPAFFMYSPWEASARREKGAIFPRLEDGINTTLPRMIVDKDFFMHEISGLDHIPCVTESNKAFALDPAGNVHQGCCLIPFEESTKLGHFLDLSFDEIMNLANTLPLCLDCKKKGYHYQFILTPHIEYTLFGYNRDSGGEHVGINQLIRDFLKRPSPPEQLQEKSVYMYGLVGGERIISLLHGKGMKFSGIIDDNPNLANTTYEGVAITALSEMDDVTLKGSVVILGFIRPVSELAEFKKKLLTKGCAAVYSLYEVIALTK